MTSQILSSFLSIYAPYWPTVEQMEIVVKFCKALEDFDGLTNEESLELLREEAFAVDLMDESTLEALLGYSRSVQLAVLSKLV